VGVSDEPQAASNNPDDTIAMEKALRNGMDILPVDVMPWMLMEGLLCQSEGTRPRS
jgi:hypothetical protein